MRVLSRRRAAALAVAFAAIALVLAVAAPPADAAHTTHTRHHRTHHRVHHVTHRVVHRTAFRTAAFDPARYPWPAQNSWVPDGHGYWEGECTSYVAWALRADGRAHWRLADTLGNAGQWTGAAVVGSPQPGDVAQWLAGFGGADGFGHVAYVIARNADGTVVVAEYNWYQFHRFDSRVIAVRAPSRYLRF